MANKFIKVTPKGEKQPRIVLATLKAFYLSQGAKVEIPTDEEVYAAEPTERPRNTAPAQPTASQANEIAQLKAQIAEAAKANAELAQHATQDQATIQQQAAELADLRTKLEAAEITITESEKVIENLRKELAKTETKANKKAAAAQ